MSDLDTFFVQPSPEIGGTAHKHEWDEEFTIDSLEPEPPMPKCEPGETGTIRILQSKTGTGVQVTFTAKPRRDYRLQRCKLCGQLVAVKEQPDGKAPE